MSGGVTGTHVANEAGKISDDNARDAMLLALQSTGAGKSGWLSRGESDQVIVTTGGVSVTAVNGLVFNGDTLGLPVAVTVQIPDIVSSVADPNMVVRLFLDGTEVARQAAVVSSTGAGGFCFFRYRTPMPLAAGVHLWYVDMAVLTNGTTTITSNVTSGVGLSSPSLEVEFV